MNLDGKGFCIFIFTNSAKMQLFQLLGRFPRDLRRFSGVCDLSAVEITDTAHLLQTELKWLFKHITASE